MDEIEKLHSIDLEWGCITNLVNRIVDIESTIDGGWEELTDMLGDALMDESIKDDPTKTFFYLYSFLFHLYFRLKNDPTKREFNKYIEANKAVSQEEKYEIYFYDYPTFKWAIDHGFTDSISNSVITVLKSKLTPKQCAAFDKRCRKGAK